MNEFSSNPQLSQEAPEKVFLKSEVSHFLVTLYQDEKPPLGLLGLLDWYLNHSVSHLIQSGFLMGNKAELTFFKPKHKMCAEGFRSYPHLLILGLGKKSEVGEKKCDASMLNGLQKKILKIGIQRLGLSQSDLGETNSEKLQKSFKGVPLWITP